MANIHLSYKLDVDSDYKWLFATPTLSAKNSLPFVQEVGDFPAHIGYFTLRSGLPSYMLSLTVGGKGTLKYDGSTYELVPGSFYWIDCMKEQYFCTNSETGDWHTFWVHIYGPSCKEYYELFQSMSSGSAVLHFDDPSAISFHLKQLLHIYSNQDTSLEDDLLAANIITGIMTRSIMELSPTRQNEVVPEHVINIKHYIAEHYTEPITLDVLAEKLSLNKFYLQKLFRKYTGSTPNEYLMRVRIQHVKELLSSTDYPISRIAGDVGMNNLGHFIEVFKKLEGISPSMFRKHWYGGKNPRADE